MKDKNEFSFSGVVEDFRRIETKTGTPMISFSVMCWRERIRVVAFKSIAEQTDLQRGDRVEVRGHIQSTLWTDQQGQQRSGWQVICHEVRKAEDDMQEQPPVPRQQQEPKPEPRQERMFQQDQRPDQGAQFAYQGGPF